MRKAALPAAYLEDGSWTTTEQAPQLSKITATTAGRSYSLHYFDRPASGPAILYVHGLGCTKADFMEMTAAPELQPFRLVSADHPGCGDSPYDDNHPLNIDGVVGAIDDFVSKLGLNRFLLVGGSMGGLVALLYAERNPSKIVGFVNVEGNLAPEDCMFSRSVIPHSYSHFVDVIFPQIKKNLSAKKGRGFAQHLRVLKKPTHGPTTIIRSRRSNIPTAATCSIGF